MRFAYSEITETPLFFIRSLMKDQVVNAKRLNAKLLMEIAAVICVKLFCLTLIWFAFFSTETRVEQSPESVSRALLSPSTTLNQQVGM